MNTLTRNTLAMVAVAALHVTFFAATAHADEAPVARVGYADLNLETAAGAKVLYKRIRVAAEQVCGDIGSRQLDVAAAAQGCVDRAIESAYQMVSHEQSARAPQHDGVKVGTDLKVAAR